MTLETHLQLAGCADHAADRRGHICEQACDKVFRETLDGALPRGRQHGRRWQSPLLEVAEQGQVTRTKFSQGLRDNWCL